MKSITFKREAIGVYRIFVDNKPLEFEGDYDACFKKFWSGNGLLYEALKNKFKNKPPNLLIVKCGNDDKYITGRDCKVEFLMQGVPIEWKYFLGYEDITEDVINKEENVERKFLLMSEYGIGKYLKDIKSINKQIVGKNVAEIIEATTEGVRMRFIKWINGTEIPKGEKRKFWAKRGMLTEKGEKIYYFPVAPDKQDLTPGDYTLFSFGIMPGSKLAKDMAANGYWGWET